MPSPGHACFAITPPGLEPLAAAELARLGAEVGRLEPGGVSFPATDDLLYRANLELRTVSRVLVRLAEFPARAFYELERKAGRVPWGAIVAPGAAVTFRVTSRKSRLYHQDGIAERLLASSGGAAAGVPDESSAVDAADSGGPAPGVQLFVVRVIRDVVTISADSSGEHLHRRGYRLATAKAPLRENLAAAMLLAAGYDGTTPLLDPLCGAGTIPIEAALIARRIPPGLGRRFGFESWPSHDRGTWDAVRGAARGRILPGTTAAIAGSDRDAGAITAATANAARAGVAGDITFRQGPLAGVRPPAGSGLLVTNPPYGVRIGERREAEALHAELGSVARERAAGWRVAFLAADPGLAAATGLALAPLFDTSNGGLPVRLLATPR